MTDGLGALADPGGLYALLALALWELRRLTQRVERLERVVGSRSPPVLALRDLRGS